MARLTIHLTDDKGASFEVVLPVNFDQPGGTLVLEDHGPRKINVIKEIRAFTGKSLKDAKDASEQLPFTFKASEVVPGFTLEQFKQALMEHGAVWTYRPGTPLKPIDLLKRIVDAATF